MSVFQDKEIAIYDAVPMQSADSKGKRPAESPRSTAMVNVRTVTDMLVAESWGLEVNRDIQVTCSNPIDVAPGEYVGYQDDMFKVVGAPIYDSHVALMCKRI